MSTGVAEKLKVVSLDFFMIKNIVVPSSLSSLSLKLVCCIVPVFSNYICILKSIAISS